MAYKNLLFKDTLIGNEGLGPDRGKWFVFFAVEKPGVDTFNEVCTNTVSGCRLGTSVNGEGWGALCLFSRAEFKPPFKLSVNVKPMVYGFYLYLLSPDARDGFFLNSNMYGKKLLAVYGTSADYKFKLDAVQNGQTQTQASENTWTLETEYIIILEVNVYTENSRKFFASLVVKLASNGQVLWETSNWFDQSVCETLRPCLAALAPANGRTEFYTRNFKVHGNQSRKAKAVVNAVTIAVKQAITDDVIDFKVVLREGSHPQASLTLRNPGNKYSSLSHRTEVEIRAGTEAVLWLLFRGFLMEPERSSPPPRLRVECCSYAKLLDYREAHGKEYDDVTSGYIVRDLVEAYYGAGYVVFTAKNVDNGKTIDEEYYSVPVSKAIKELADANNYLWGVDFNKDVYFIPPSKARSRSTLSLEGKTAHLNIVNREVDEVVNYVRQIGKTVSGQILEYTASDSESEYKYWRRDKTFKDTSLRTQRAVQHKAEGLLEKLKDVKREVALSTAHILPIDLYCIVTLTCPEVGLTDYEMEAKTVEYSYNARGVRTSVLFQSRGFRLADALAMQHESSSWQVLVTLPGGVVVEPGGTLDKTCTLILLLDYPTITELPTMTVQLSHQLELNS